MSLQAAQQRIIEIYEERFTEYKIHVRKNDGPQLTYKLQDFIRKSENKHPLRVPAEYGYSDRHSYAEERENGARIQKYQNFFEQVWEVCEEAELVSSRLLRQLIDEYDAKPLTIRRQRGPRA